MLERRAASRSGVTGFLKGLAESQWLALKGIPSEGLCTGRAFRRGVGP